MEYNIKESKELINFLFNLADAIINATSDGNINLVDAPLFLKPLIKAGEGIGGINLVPKELSDLSDEETAEIYTLVKERFNISNDKVEGYIENAFMNALQLFRNFKQIYSLAGTDA